MFKVMILICSVSVSPYHCTSHTAKQVVEGPILGTQHDCLIEGHEMLLPTSLYRGDRKLKIYGISGCVPAKTA